MTNHDEQMKAVARLVSGRPDWIDAPAVQAWHRSDGRTEHDGTPGKPRIWSPDYRTTERWSTPSLQNVHWSDLVDVVPLAAPAGSYTRTDEPDDMGGGVTAALIEKEAERNARGTNTTAAIARYWLKEYDCRDADAKRWKEATRRQTRRLTEMTRLRDQARDTGTKWQVEANMRKIRAEDTLSLVQQQRDQATALAEQAELERDEARETIIRLREEMEDHDCIRDAAVIREPHWLTPEDIEAPTITLYRASDPNHVRVKVEHPAFGVFGEVVHLPNTREEVAEDLWVSFSSEEVLIEHPLIGRHARALDIPVSDEMVKRAKLKAGELGWFRRFDAPGDEWKQVLTAALTEPPARPEGAEHWEDFLIDSLDYQALTDQQIANLADKLAEHGVRVVGEEEKR